MRTSFSSAFILYFCLAFFASFTQAHADEEELKRQANEIDKISKNCYWEVELLEPSAQGAGYQSLDFSFGKHPQANDHYIIRIKHANQTRFPYFFPNARLDFTLPTRPLLQARALPELNVEPDRSVFGGVFMESRDYFISTSDLYQLLKAPSFDLTAEGTNDTIKASFHRYDH